MSEHHPYSDFFPMLEGEEQQELIDDIAAHGLRTRIVRDEKGRILDGRNREAACIVAGVPPTYEEFSGSDEQKLEFVKSQNLHRRHMNTSQRASAAAKFKGEFAKLGKARQRENGASRAKTKKKSPANLPGSKKGDARDQAGKAFKVSGKAVDMAEKVHKKAIPEIVAAMDAGNLRVSAALDVASLPLDQQQTIMDNGGVPAVRAAAAVVRRSRGRKVILDGSRVSETPPHPPSIPVGPPAIASDAKSTKEMITALVKIAIAAPHSYRMEVIESVLPTLPEDKVLWVRRRCDDVLSDRRRHSETASG